MIIVKNTKELELMYNLNTIQDDEQIMVTGGLTGKKKYNEECYTRRVTYPARQIKQIISQMKEIENNIPSEWNKWQRAKYIYKALASNIGYNYNRQEYANEQSSNLSILLSRKGICAGFSLLYKEMMDRQSIKCDYIRGHAVNSRGKTVKHAWNIVTIDGVSFPIDLTWEVPNMQRGESKLQYFGNRTDFLKEHNQDYDERVYNLKCLSQEYVNSINIDTTAQKRELSQQEKFDIVQRAIEETYKKFEKKHGAVIAKKQVINAVNRYVREAKTDYFSRDNMAREGIEENLTQEDMLEILVSQYSYNLEEQAKRGILANGILGKAVQTTSIKYGLEQGKGALKKYLKNNEVKCFTRTDNVRDNIINYMSRTEALNIIIEDMIEKEIESISKTANIRENNISQMSKRYFDALELSEVKLPVEKKNIITKAIEWIRSRTLLRSSQKNHLKENINRQKSKENER